MDCCQLPLKLTEGLVHRYLLNYQKVMVIMPLKIKSGLVGYILYVLQQVTLFLPLKIHLRLVGLPKVRFHGNPRILLLV